MMVHSEWAALHPRIQQTSSHHCENMRSYLCLLCLQVRTKDLGGQSTTNEYTYAVINNLR